MSEIDARDSDDVTLTFTISPNASPGVSFWDNSQY